MECKESYALNFNNQCVSNCGEGFWINANPKNFCDSCIENCITCTDGAICDVCEEGYYMTSLKTCVMICT